MNKKQIEALKQANQQNEIIANNEKTTNLEIQAVKNDLEDKKAMQDGQPEPIAHKPTTNVEEKAVDLVKLSRTIVKADVKRLVNTFDYKMQALLTVCGTVNGANYLAQNNMKITDITKKQVLKTLTSLVINGKNLHVRIVSLKEDKTNICTADLLAVHLGQLDEKGVFVPATIETVEIKFSILDRGFDFQQTDKNELILTKGKKTYTFAIVETLSYNVIIDRLASYRKINNVQVTKDWVKRVENREKAEKAEILAKEKAEKTEAQKAKLLATFSADELLELAKKAQSAA